MGEFIEKTAAIICCTLGLLVFCGRVAAEDIYSAPTVGSEETEFETYDVNVDYEAMGLKVNLIIVKEEEPTMIFTQEPETEFYSEVLTEEEVKELESQTETQTTEPTTEPETQAQTYNVNLSFEEARDIIRPIAEKHGLETNLLLAIAWHESRFRTNALGDGGKAHGMFQIHPEFWPCTVDELYNPYSATEHACNILLNWMHVYGYDIHQAVNCYNTGSPNFGYADSVFEVKAQYDLVS